MDDDAAAASASVEAFTAFEHNGWERLAAPYHERFGSLTTQAVGPMLDAVGMEPGMRVLDVATGPGYLAAPRPQPVRMWWP